MSESIPNALLESQAVKLVESLIEQQEEGSLTPEEIQNKLFEIIARFEEHAGSPLLGYPHFYESEPALSKKINKLWKAIEADIVVSQYQLDLNRATAIASFNLIRTEVDKAKQRNNRLHNKLKSLQLYSNVSDDSITTFGDSFQSLDFLDRDLVNPSNIPTLAAPGFVTLPRRGSMENVASGAAIKVLRTSNGFLGNNQSAKEEDGTVFFDSDIVQPNDLKSLLDAAPDTWIEYEKYKVPQAQRLNVGNLNFEYVNETGERIDWANGPSGDVLKLGLELDLGSAQNINQIELVPFPLKDGINFPFKIRLVETSSNATDWTPVRPTGVSVGTNFNLDSLRAADNLVLKHALWSFDSRPVRYVRIYIEQDTPLNLGVGHPYWVDTSTERLERAEGPIPSIGEVKQSRSKTSFGSLEQRFEVLAGQRWAIGLREVAANQIQYKETGTFVSDRLRIDGIIDRVILEDIDVEIPESFDSSEEWVKFYVSPDDGETWLRITEIEDVSREIPEQIAFNDPLPEGMREPGVQNHNTDEAVEFIRVKIEMSRPTSSSSSTPVLKSYRLKAKRR